MASSDDSSIFIRKDIFDVRMDRMEILLEKTLSEMRADNERFRSEIKIDINNLTSKTQEEIQGLRPEIRVIDERVNSLTTRVDTLQTTVYWGFALLTLFLGLTTFTPALLEFIKSLRKPSITANEI